MTAELADKLDEDAFANHLKGPGQTVGPLMLTQS